MIDVICKCGHAAIDHDLHGCDETVSRDDGYEDDCDCVIGVHAVYRAAIAEALQELQAGRSVR